MEVLFIKIKKYLWVILLGVLFILAIASVSAEDLNDTDVELISDEVAVDEDIFLSQDNQDTILGIDDAENNTLEVVEGEVLTAEYQYFSDIQEKIDSASPGDTIYLNGTYYGFGNPIIINKSITLKGLGDGAQLKANINTNLKQCAIYVKHSDVTIDNLKISNGCDQWGGGILIYYSSPLYKRITITNCQIKDNSADGNYGYGGGIFFWTEDSIINNCTFISNHCTDFGGAIYTNGLNNKIMNSKFSYNYISNELSGDGLEYFRGGAAIYSDCQSLIIDNCTFSENSARESYGGALRLAASGIVRNSNFKSNIALLAKGIYVTNDNITFNGNSFFLEYKEDPNALFGGITADKLKSSNTFNKTRIDTSVKFSAEMIMEYSTSGSIYVTVDGGVIDKTAIKVINHPEAKISFIDNVITVSNLNVGKYTLSVTTIPDDDHKSVDSTLPITVKKATAVIKASSATVVLKKGTVWVISLVNSKTGKPISNVELTLNVYTGKSYKPVKVKTNSNGIASFKTNILTKGTHKIVVRGTHEGYNFNTLTSSIKVIKPKALKFRLHKKNNSKKGSLVTYQVLDKKTKKGVNGVKVKVLIYTGKKFKTINLKTKKIGKYKGIAGFFTNEYSVGKHKVVIKPISIKYSGSGKTSIIILKSAKKYPAKTSKA